MFEKYGYAKTYKYLNDEYEFKKSCLRTYNLMKENGLLKFQRDKKKGVINEYTKPTTPEQNTRIEFYHRII